MANPDSPFGLKPITRDGSAGYSGAVREYIIAAAEGTDLFVGDPVNLSGTSILDLTDDKYKPGVVRATAGSGSYTTGVIVGFKPITDESPTYKTDAVTQRTVLVCDDPMQLFEIQADGSIAITDIGETADIIFTHAGSTVTGFSGAELDTSDIGTGSQLVIEGVRQQDRNDLNSANPVLIVRISEHQKFNTSTGV